MRDAVDDLIWDEAPKEASAIAILDAPALVEDALQLTSDVRVFCDDWRDAQLVDPQLLVTHPSELAGVSLALARLPKSLAALDEQAASVQGADDVTFIGGARIKHLNRTMNEVLGKHFAAVSASLGRSKSRVLRAWGPEHLESDWPKVRLHEDLRISAAAHGGTFGGTKIDTGTRLLLSALAGKQGNAAFQPGKVLDFGSGNGSISAWLAKRGSAVHARDVSWSAVAATLIAAEVNEVSLEATWGAGLEGYEQGSFDAIVTNPPFHDGIAKDSSATLEMFSAAAQVIRPGGQLWCVFNSHLPYRKELNAHLGQTVALAQDRQYTVTLTTLQS